MTLGDCTHGMINERSEQTNILHDLVWFYKSISPEKQQTNDPVSHPSSGTPHTMQT